MIEHSVTAYDITRTKSGDASIVLTSSEGERVFLLMDSEVASGLSKALDYYSRPEDDELLSLRKVADLCGVHERSIRSRVRHNTMPTPDVDIEDPRTGGRMLHWWRSTIERSDAIGRRSSREVGEGDIAGLFWAIVLLAALGKGCGIG